MAIDRPLIHIGYHKTGTTLLESKIFSRADLGFGMVGDHRFGVRTLILADPFRFDPDSVRAAYARAFESAGRPAIPVIANELLSGNPRRARAIGRVNADRLAACFPAARVLITVREQRSILLSWYKHHIRAGSSLPIRRMIIRPDRERLFEPLFPLEYFRYDALVEHYRGLFGEDRVLVLPFELVRADPRRYAESLLAFAGAPAAKIDLAEKVNPGLSPPAIALLRRLNALTPEPSVEPATGPLFRFLLRAVYKLDRPLAATLGAAPQPAWHDHIARISAGVFGDSNRRLGETCGIDLGGLGYDVGDNGVQAVGGGVP